MRHSARALVEGDDVFGPRDLGLMLAVLLRDGPPAVPLVIGL